MAGKPPKRTLATLIVWIAQAAGSPLSVKNAEELLEMLPPELGTAGAVSGEPVK